MLEMAEEAGEPITVTFRQEGHEEGRRVALVPAATLARWEHWAPCAYPAGGAGDGDRDGVGRPEPAHPQECGAFTFFRRRVSGRTAIAREGVVVAELLALEEARWLQEQARNVSQSFMDPQQKAAFEEFLARQSRLGQQ